MNKRRDVIKAIAGSMLLGATAGVRAQSSQPLRVLCGYPAGGVTDIVSRLFADQLRIALGEPVIVENRVGAGGRLAAQALAAAKDGRTYMVAPNSMPIFQEILYPPNVLGYDMFKDWKAVGTLTTYPFGMVVLSKLGVNNVMEYIEWAKANPTQAMYGCGGAGGQGHFAGTQLAMASGLPLAAVPYKGNGPVNIDLLGEHIPAAILPATDLMPHRNNPKLKILGIFENERSPLVPEVPTFAEQGLAFDVGRAWMGMWASASAPDEEVARVANAVQGILQDEQFKQQLVNRFTMYPLYTPREDMEQWQRNEIAIWRPVIEASGFKADS